MFGVTGARAHKKILKVVRTCVYFQPAFAMRGDSKQVVSTVRRCNLLAMTKNKLTKHFRKSKCFFHFFVKVAGPSVTLSPVNFPVMDPPLTVPSNLM